MHPDEIASALAQTRDENGKARRAALLALCPCHVRSNVHQVWDRLFEMLADEDAGVRSIVLHCLTDGSPRSRETEVIEALESLANDPDPKLRRRARRAVAEYRRTGRIIEA